MQRYNIKVLRNRTSIDVMLPALPQDRQHVPAENLPNCKTPLPLKSILCIQYIEDIVLD